VSTRSPPSRPDHAHQVPEGGVDNARLRKET
jgi:hypothetical protein